MIFSSYIITTPYHRFVRWSRAGIFNKIVHELARQSGVRDGLMIDATHLKAYRTAASLLKNWPYPAILAARKAV